MAFFGLQPDAPPVPDLQAFWLWPENLEAWLLFMEVQTEWRGSGGSREGLDKGGVERIMRAQRVRGSRRQRRFNDIRIMERACLQVWWEQAKAAADKG